MTNYISFLKAKIGDFQNNYRSGWDVILFNDDMPFDDFSREPLNLNFNYQIPHDRGFADDRPSSHHTSAHYADDNHLEYQRGHRYADDRPSSHHTSAHYADMKRLKDRKLARFCKRHLPRQRPECYVDKRQLPDQMPGHYNDKRPLPHQTPKGFADKRNLPLQTPEDFADIRSLPHQKPEDYADNKSLPHRVPKPYSDKRCLPQQTPEDFADKCSPHQTLGPTIPAIAPVQSRQSNIICCKICNIKMHRNCLEGHNNGKKHRMLLKSTERSVPNGRDSRVFPNSSGMKLVVQPMKMAESKKNGHPVENVCREAPRFSNKEVPAVGSKLKFGDYAGAKDRGFKVGKMRPSFKQKNVLAESSTRKLGDNTGPKDRGLKGENVKNEAPILKHKNVPDERSKRKLMDNTGAKDDGSKRDIMGAAGDKYMKMDNGVRRPVKSSKPETNDKSGSVKSLVQRPGLKSSKPVANAKSSSVKSLVQRSGLKQPSGCVASPKRTPIPVEGSSFEIQSQHVSASLSRHVSASLSQESKGKEHHKFQNIVEKNDQPQLVNASTGSNMTDTTGSMTNNQTEVVNSDYAAVKVVTEPDASASSFELLSERGLDTVVEPQVSEAAVEIDAPSEVSTETEAADESSQSEVEMDVLVTVSETTKLPQIPVCLTCGDVGFEETLVSCNKCKACALHRYCLDGPVIFTDEVIWFCEDCEPYVVVINDSDSESTDSDDETTNSDIEITDSEKGEVVVINDSDSESTDSDDETTDSDIEITDSEKGEVDSSKGCATAVTIADPQPISDPIWRGSLLVLNKSFGKIITGLLCHLSTLACPKVLEETKHLPNVLEADMIQREAVWPESFRKFGTNNLSIGLYFFPQNERDERYFDQLVDEMISTDLAMRARVDKAELLIFPSTMLPRKYKRFQSKYYLWGVYRRNQVPSKMHDTGSRNE